MGKDSRKPWGADDLLIAEAYEIFRRERCEQCGQMIWVCHNHSEEVGFRFEEGICYATRDREKREAKSKKTDEQRRGVTLQPVHVRRGDGVLDDAYRMELRESYYRDLFAKAQAIAKSGS